MKPSVRQHYLPACYLARFTVGGERDSPFFVHSPIGHPLRESIPDREGFECHYHDVAVPRLRPDHLEREFQKVEAPACALFKTLSGNPGRWLLTDAEKDIVLLFFAIQAGRLPQSKERYEQGIVAAGRGFLEMMAYSREFFDRTTAVAKRWGVFTEPDEQSSLRKAVDGGHIIAKADDTGLAVGLLRLADAILDRLHGKHHTLWYSDGPEWFVCSDYPVGLFYSLSFGDAVQNPAALENPIVEVKNRTIFMPLAYNVALVIHPFSDRSVVQRANERMVAVVNTVTISHSQRFICSRTPEFTCVLPNRKIGNSADAIAVLRLFSQDASSSK